MTTAPELVGAAKAAGNCLNAEEAAGRAHDADVWVLDRWGRAEGDFVESRLEQETYITQTESDSTFGFGGYARAGIEFEWPSGGTFGVGARGFLSSLNLDSVADDADIKGVQGYITFTQGF